MLFVTIAEGPGLLEPAGTAAVPVAAGEAIVPPPGLVPASRASPVVVRVVLTRGSLTNLIWSKGTATSRSPIPKYPPTPITTAWSLPLSLKIKSLMSPSYRRYCCCRHPAPPGWKPAIDLAATG